MTPAFFRRLSGMAACAAALFCAATAYAQSAVPAVLVVGGASHTQSGFPDPQIQRFYIASAANAAEQMAEALGKVKVRNAKFITWSRYPGYQQELGINLAGCDCNFILQVSFGKNVEANPQTLFLEYQLMYLAKATSQQPGFSAVVPQPRFRRRFDFPITNDILTEGKFPDFATEIAGEIVKPGILTTPENTK